MTCQDVSLHVLTFAGTRAISYSMDMGRIKKHVNLALDPALLQRLDEWMRAQEAPWTKTAAFEIALGEFLEKRSED